ncbi:MAG TPA: bifunctional 2-polyprenyl-6-hydroxyphenol methylase/3-demethylubiquinol 3-O-methyltransferase UbiG [Steroidobacteraceae bacterium]|nr:bifunctional 2-polyprenyl-6-hydroxyphenol methylase/3-demethylubiquinol 3-O-methyltransferase UbiG [Steroidobacteraceae bacterium]
MSTAASGALLSAEVRKFDTLAHEFWDPRGAFHPLHALNPVRLEFIARRTALPGRRVLDVGCGGGLLAEGLARANASVSAIDLAPSMIEVAQLHAHESALAIDYQICSAEQYAARGAEPFDVLTCMELIEHVPEPAALLAALGKLLRPGGDLFVSTINRNLRSFLLAIVGAEYLMRLVPRGTHEYERLLRPSELARLARASGLELREIAGIAYDPFARTARLSADPRVNYLAHFRRAALPAPA